MAEQKYPHDWYEQLYATGLFFVLEFLDTIIWTKSRYLNRDISFHPSVPDPVDKDILKRYLNNLKTDSISNDSRQVLELHVPDFSELPWPVIIELRHDKRITSFWRYLGGYAGDSGGTELQRQLEHVWKSVEEVFPNPKDVAVQIIIGNIPLPLPVNPLSIASSFFSFLKHIKWRRENKWLLFLCRARQECREQRTPKIYTESTQPFIGPDNKHFLNEGHVWLTNWPEWEAVRSNINGRIFPWRGRSYQFRYEANGDIFVKPAL